MNREYTIRPYQLGDEDEIVELLQIGFGGWPKLDLNCSPLEHWKWKYLKTPYKRNFTALSLHRGRIIGANHEMLYKVKIGDEVSLCAYSSDMVVHPNFRRRGISDKLIEMSGTLREDGDIRFVYWVTSKPFLIKSYSKKYPSFPYLISNLVRIRDIDKQLQAIPVENASLMRLGFHTAKFINDLRNAFKGSKKIDLCIRRINSFDARIDLFWKKVSVYYRFIVERSRKYLNWRYCDPRAGDFIVKHAEDDEGSILGYSVLKINRYRKDYPIGYIVDLLTLPEGFNVVDVLVADAVKYFDDNNVNIINCLLVKNHPYQRVLNRHGFIDSRIKPYIFYLGEEVFKPDQIPPNKVFFSYGDIDSLPTGLD